MEFISWQEMLRVSSVSKPVLNRGIRCVYCPRTALKDAFSMDELRTMEDTQPQVRRLCPSDIPQIELLIESHCNDLEGLHQGFLNIDLENFLAKNQDESILYGAYLSNKLLCITGVFYWTDMPYTTLCLMVTDRKAKASFDPIKNGIGYCLAQILVDSEKRGYYTHYSCRRLKEIRLEYRYKIWEKYLEKFEIAKRYIGFNEEFIAKNTRPKHAVWWDIMEQEKYSYDVVIRCIKLKNEFRTISSSIGLEHSW